MDVLVAGLGNPGRRYASTRHNVGFMAAERLAKRWEFVGEREKFGALLQEGRSPGGVTVALLRPQVFMNLSGGPVRKARQAYGVHTDDIVVVHDDVESAFGRVRAKAGGGLAGHNGLRSLRAELGTQEYLRVRLGIGRQRPGDRRDLADWVLSPFESDEDVDALIEQACDCLELLIDRGIDDALAQYV